VDFYPSYRITDNVFLFSNSLCSSFLNKSFFQTASNNIYFKSNSPYSIPNAKVWLSIKAICNGFSVSGDENEKISRIYVIARAHE
jgi:hypothetical protein